MLSVYHHRHSADSQTLRRQAVAPAARAPNGFGVRMTASLYRPERKKRASGTRPSNTAIVWKSSVPFPGTQRRGQTVSILFGHLANPVFENA